MDRTAALLRPRAMTVHRGRRGGTSFPMLIILCFLITCASDSVLMLRRDAVSYLALKSQLADQKPCQLSCKAKYFPMSQPKKRILKKNIKLATKY